MNVLVVEDDPIAAEMIVAVLEEMGCVTETAANGVEAMQRLRRGDFPVVISDWEMPEMDGLDLCRAIRAESLGRYVYFMLLTSRQGAEHLIEGLAAGADDFMSKPIRPEELTVRLRGAERVIALESRSLTIFALAKLAESRDPETGAHLDRVREYARLLASDLSGRESHRDRVPPGFVNLIYETSPLHDIGKVAIPDHVLLKPGRLDAREFEIMKTHAQAGADTLDKAMRQHASADFLRMARDIAGCHHERWDGDGYPNGLAGEAIPLAARVFAVADVYDALVSKRVYKAAFTHDVARSIILGDAGGHFDPDAVDAFARCEERFAEVAQRTPDEPDDATVPVESVGAA